MITIYPAIDLKDGKVVRLSEGDMARATIYNDDPVAQANVFHETGADHLHVIDLDGAFAGASAMSSPRSSRAFPAGSRSAAAFAAVRRSTTGWSAAWRAS